MKTGPEPPRRTHVWLGLAVAVIAFAPYAQTAGFEFTYDDRMHVVNNDFVHDPGNVVEMLPWRYLDRELRDQGRPVFVATLLLDAAVGGRGPAAHHVQSAIWHALVSVLVFVLALRLGLPLRPSVVAATLFALHPAHAEAVACVSNREEPLTVFFSLAALLAARRAFVGGRLRWVAAAGGLYALALGSKELAVVVPALLVLVLLCFPSWRAPKPTARRIYAWTAAVLLVVTAGWAGFQLQLGYPSLLAGAGGTGLEAARSEAPVDPLAPSTGPPPAPRRVHGEIRQEHILSFAPFRLWQLFVPWPLSPEYELAPFKQPWALGLGAVALALLGAAAWWGWRRFRALAFGLGWFAVATGPVALPWLIVNPLADRFLYLPAVGVSILVSFAADRWWPRDRPLAARLATVGVVVALAVLAFASVRQIRVWQDDVTLFEHAARHAPRSARVHQNLGAARLGADDLPGARRALGRAVELDPALLAGHFNLGLVAERSGRRDDAVGHYREALRRPSLVGELPLRERALRRLGRLLLSLEREAELESVITSERVHRPRSPAARDLSRQLARRRERHP